MLPLVLYFTALIATVVYLWNFPLDPINPKTLTSQSWIYPYYITDNKPLRIDLFPRRNGHYWVCDKHYGNHGCVKWSYQPEVLPRREVRKLIKTLLKQGYQQVSIHTPR